MEDNMTVTDGEEFTISTLTETEDSTFCIDEEEFQFAWHFNKNSSSWYVLSIYLHILNWFKDSFFLPDSIIDYVSLAHAVTLIVEDANTKLGVADIACGVAKNIDDNYKSLEPLDGGFMKAPSRVQWSWAWSIAQWDNNQHFQPSISHRVSPLFFPHVSRLSAHYGNTFMI